MKNYEVSVYVTECQTDTFKINASDIDEARGLGMQEAFDRGYDIDDVIDVVEVEGEDSESDIIQTCLSCGRSYTRKEYDEIYTNEVYDCNGKLKFLEDTYRWICWCGNEIAVDYNSTKKNCEDSPESDIEQDRRCHGKYQEEEEIDTDDIEFEKLSKTGSIVEVNCPYCNTTNTIPENNDPDWGVFQSCSNCKLTFVAFSNQVSKLDWEVEKTRRKSFNLLPSEQQEAVKKAIAEFEETKEFYIEEPCNCGSHIQHNNGGNYHVWYDIKKDGEKYFIREGSTSELEPPYQWEESTKEGVLQLIQNCADWL